LPAGCGHFYRAPALFQTAFSNLERACLTRRLSKKILRYQQLKLFEAFHCAAIHPG